ncbi:YaiO family outer membrane beta-barrel protein [Legionella cherrii]|uniref:TRP containing protein n=1 Tax=Legionella cherrii TaxID=28084 RepID=A0A0W0SCH5_9GAMM|nr:YaiO family outer membrane beta-barrel protein [Legionella cherrii]KTC80833.1 TRP containing protein [Legionella cherrii]VEB34229.1 TRP containing protein [Legionella cherrii]
MKKVYRIIGTALGIPLFLLANKIFAVNPTGIITPSVINKSTTNNPKEIPLKKALAKATSTQVQEDSEEAKKLYKERLKKNPGDEDARLLLANYYIAKRRDLTALRVIKQGLRLNPNSVLLLMKLSDIQTYLTAYAPAIATNKKILTLDPNNVYSKQYLSDVKQVVPRYDYGVNEVGFTTDNSYVTGFHQIWDYSSLYYTRDTSYGRFGGRINFAARQGFTAPQYELDFSPVLNRDVSFNLVATYANQPNLFSDYSYGGQANISLTSSLQFTGGAIYSNIAPTFFMTYIAGLNYAVGNYLLSVTPYYFVPQTNVKSVLMTGVIKRFFATEDHSISLTVGIGHSPNLANLTTVDFIVLKNDFANLLYEFPILAHRLVVDLQIGYQRWEFPTGEINNFYDTLVGLKYRF